MADRIGYNHFANYYTRFGYNEETIRKAAYPCSRPLTPLPYDYAFLKELVRLPLYGYIRSWLW